MGKYRSPIKKIEPVPERPHAIWRGIGCLLMLIIPALSFAISAMLIDYGIEHKWPIPYEVRGFISLPAFIYKSGGLTYVLSPLARIPNLAGILALGIILMITIGGLISLVYAWIYRFTGPERYGPTDEPPPSRKIKKISR